MRDKAGVAFWMYTFSQFLHFANEYLGYSATDEAIEEVKHVSKIPNDTSVSSLTDSDLKNEALLIVSGIRGLLAEYRKEQDEYSYLRFSRDIPIEERDRIWDEMNYLSSQSTSKLMSTYNQLYKVKAIVIKDELLYRLSNLERDSHKDFIYTHPTNPLGIEDVADDLEHLAILL